MSLAGGYIQQVADEYSIISPARKSGASSQVSDGEFSGPAVMQTNSDSWPYLFLAIKFETYSTIHSWARLDVYIRQTDIFGAGSGLSEPAPSDSEPMSYVASVPVAGSGSTPTPQAHLLQVPAPRDSAAIYLRPVGFTIASDSVSIRTQYRSITESAG